jgi:hypothetical protein
MNYCKETNTNKCPACCEKKRASHERYKKKSRAKVAKLKREIKYLCLVMHGDLEYDDDYESLKKEFDRLYIY